jgi:hypothetical protein
MAVTFSVSGRLRSPAARVETLRFAAERAAELDWQVVPVKLEFPTATVRDAGTNRVVAPFRAEGLSLRPHFACDPLHFVFTDDEAALVDAYVHEDADGSKVLEAGTLVNTHFAGPGVHRELCEFLRDVVRTTGAGLKVDDETGFFADGDEPALAAAFAEAWRSLRARLRADRRKPGDPFDVGEFPFQTSDGVRREEFAQLGPETARRITEFEGALATMGAEAGLKVDRGPEAALDLELMADDFAAPDSGYDTDEAREGAANHLGAAFGRILVAHFGGFWRHTPEYGLAVHDVGGTGLIVDPILVGWKRLTEGPVHSLTNHYDAYAALVRGLAEEDPAR